MSSNDVAEAVAAGQTERHEVRCASVLRQVSQMIGGTLDLDTVLNASMAATAEAMEVDACTIFLRAPDAEALCFHTVRSRCAGALREHRVPIDDKSIAGWVAHHRRALSIPDAYRDERFNRSFDDKTGYRTRSILCAPLEVRGRLVGVMQLLNRRDGLPFDAWDSQLSEAVASLVAVAVDSAEQHEALIRSERLATVGQTVAGLAHCIKNILNSLQAGTYVIEQSFRQTAPPPRVVRAWDVVSRNLRFLSDVVLDMLSYAKPRRPLLQPCAVGAVCRDVADLLAEQAAEQGVSLKVVDDEAPGEVRVDETAVRRVLLNLAGNAVDACAERGGTVLMEAAPAGSQGRFVLRVSDDGCGIPPEMLQRIFEPMVSTKGGKGTGLGLAVSRKIAEEHGGTLTVASEPGRGTCFTMELPTGNGGPPPARSESSKGDSHEDSADH